MSDIQGVMKFELLPNEILFICFEHLNIFEIFHSFDRLNHHFSKLIRNIQLKLNFENVHKRIFDEFCAKILSNPEIKQQIYSLELSNKQACGQIEAFLSFFPLSEFSHLQSLKLSGVENENIEKLKTMLPSLSSLLSFDNICQSMGYSAIISALPTSNLRTLSMIQMYSLDQPSNLINLTIYGCSIEHLSFYLFQYFPMLKYLKVQYVFRYTYPINNDIRTEKYPGLHLKQLIMNEFRYHFKDLEMFVKLIPNLESLTIHCQSNISIINAVNWQNLIQSSLIYLNEFKFKFICNQKVDKKMIRQRFMQFQSDFWCKHHRWYTEHSFENHLVCIYTIPYTTKYFALKSDTKRFPNGLIKNSNVFDKVNHVTIRDKMITDQCQYHFSNVENLSLLSSKQDQTLCDINCLKMIVNLSNLNCLNILNYGDKLTSSLLLEILKQAPKLSWIQMDPNSLMLLLNDDELCIYLNKMIKKIELNRFGHPSFKNSDEMKKFCEIFSNIEQLVYHDIASNDILFLLDNLTNLSTFKVDRAKLEDRECFCALLKEKSCSSNFIFRLEDQVVSEIQLLMWIGGNNS